MESLNLPRCRGHRHNRRFDQQALDNEGSTERGMMRACCLREWIGVLILTISGCGSPVVDAGRSSRPALSPTPAKAPAIESAVPLLNDSDVQQVPAESVIRLPQDAAHEKYHNVRTGETLTSVAKQYGLPTQKLRAANGLDVTAKLKVGQMLFIPQER